MTTITISGTPGSGKSTVATMLAEKMNLPYVYSGQIFRNLADEHHMSLSEFGAYCETHKEIDQEIDNRQIDLLKKGNILLEGRLAGWLAYKNNIPAHKIMIDATVDIRASRIVNREQGETSKRKQEMIQREKSERTRYQTYYGIDLLDTTIYDIVIDSSDKTPIEILELILDSIKK